MALINLDPFLKELAEHRALLTEHVNGLTDLSGHDGINDEESRAILSVRDARQNRINLIDEVVRTAKEFLRAVQALLNDGYPTLTPVPSLPSLVADIDREIHELQLARAQFVAEGIALTGTFGAPRKKEGF